MTFTPTSLITPSPITLIGELHGQSVRACLEHVLVPMATARPGDPVAVRDVGVYLDGAPHINASLFIRRTEEGFVEQRLCELPKRMQKRCAEALGRISNDWEIYQDICGADHRLLEDGDTGLEMVRFLNGLGFIRCGKVRRFGERARLGPRSVCALMTEGRHTWRPAPPKFESHALIEAWQQMVSGAGCK